MEDGLSKQKIRTFYLVWQKRGKVSLACAGLLFFSVLCDILYVYGFTALYDLVEILVAEGGVREKETDRWERVNWSWHVSSICVSPDDTWLSPICSCCLVHSLSCTAATIWNNSFHTMKGRYPNLCPSRLAVDWQSVDLSVSGTGGLLSQPSSHPPADRQGQGLIPPVSLRSWQIFLRDTNPGQPCTPWHAPSPINIASPFSNLLLQGLYFSGCDQATSFPCLSTPPKDPHISHYTCGIWLFALLLTGLVETVLK